MTVLLKNYTIGDYSPGAGIFKRVIWYFINSVIFNSYLIPISSIKIIILRLFNAKIGNNVIIKPSVNIKYPWFLNVSDNVWIGEGVWIDNLTYIKLGSNVCISQGAYLCTGNHDWTDPEFGLIIKPINIENGVWIGAKSVILPGVKIAYHSIVTAGSVLKQDTETYGIYSGNPAVKIKERIIK